MRRPTFYILGLDFDGTLVDHMFPHIGENVPFAFETLHALVEDFGTGNLKFVLHTCRENNHAFGGEYALHAAVQHCTANGLDLWGVNCRPDIARKFGSVRKPLCDSYIDDKAIGTPILELPTFRKPVVDWKAIEPVLHARIRTFFGKD